MPSVQKIALIAPPIFDDLAKTLARAAPGRDVRRYADLYADSRRVLADRPDAVVIARHWQTEDLGCLRLLVQQLAPAPILVVSDQHGLPDQLPAHQLPTDQALAELGVTRVDRAVCPTELAELLRPPRAPEDASHAIPELARGLADEINNPLMFALGHLQLLEAALDRRPDHGKPAHGAALPALAATRGALERIQAAMTDLDHIGVAAARTAGTGEQVDLAQRLRIALERTGLHHRIPPRGAVVVGDVTLLDAMVDHLVRVATALGTATGEPSRFELHEDPTGHRWRIRFSVAGAALPKWHVRETFAPYYVTRILRGSPHGLSLVLVDAVARGHGGCGLSERHTVDGEERILIGAQLPRLA